MGLKFKYVPLTFITDDEQIKAQIKNTIILKYFFELNQSTVKLNNLIEGTQYGYNASALKNGSNKFLRISDITEGKVDWKTVPYCNCSDEETYLLKQEDLLVARTGGTTGKSFLISSPPKKSIFAGYLIRIRANKESNPEFLNLFLNSYVYWSQVTSLNKGEFRPSVNASKLKALLLPSCDDKEQLIAIRISRGESVQGFKALQDEIDRALLDYENCKGLLATFCEQKKITDNLKHSILQDAIQGKLTEDWRKNNQNIESATELLKRIKEEKEQLLKEKKIKKEKSLPNISKEEIPFELPKNWVWCRLGELTNYGSSEKIDSDDIEENTWVLDLEDIEKESSKIIQRKTFKERPSLSTKSVFKEGWVLYSKLRPYLDKVVVVEKDGVCTTEILPLRVYSNMVAKFMMYGMKGKHFLKYVNSKVGGMKMPRLKTPDGKMALIPIAPVEEQKVIVSKLESLMQKCFQLEEEIAKSQKNGDMLMEAVLREAFEIKETKVINLPTKPTNIDYYKRTLLATEIVWQLHKEPTLGHLKLQKLIYLAQESSTMQIPTNFLQQVAGPYDPKMARSLDKQMKTKKWFEYKKTELLKFKPLEKAGEHKTDFEKFFANEKESIQYIIDIFKTAKSDSIELVGTLYACWKKLIEEKQIITDELISNRFYEWSEEKAKFEKSRILKALRWMETKGVVPEKANA